MCVGGGGVGDINFHADWGLLGSPPLQFFGLTAIYCVAYVPHTYRCYTNRTYVHKLIHFIFVTHSKKTYQKTKNAHY